jgi:hypothetical protein
MNERNDTGEVKRQTLPREEETSGEVQVRKAGAFSTLLVGCGSK